MVNRLVLVQCFSTWALKVLYTTCLIHLNTVFCIQILLSNINVLMIASGFSINSMHLYIINKQTKILSCDFLVGFLLLMRGFVIGFWVRVTCPLHAKHTQLLCLQGHTKWLATANTHMWPLYLYRWKHRQAGIHGLEVKISCKKVNTPLGFREGQCGRRSIAMHKAPLGF